MKEVHVPARFRLRRALHPAFVCFFPLVNGVGFVLDRAGRPIARSCLTPLMNLLGTARRPVPPTPTQRTSVVKSTPRIDGPQLQ
jgi:hypothetical protein